MFQLDGWNKVTYVGSRSVKPASFRDQKGTEVSVRSWADILHTTAKWLMEEGSFEWALYIQDYDQEEFDPLMSQSHPDGREFELSRELPNGLFIDCNYNAKNMCPFVWPIAGRIWAGPNAVPGAAELTCRATTPQPHLPVTVELRRLTDMEPELDVALRNVLEEERRSAGFEDEERKHQLRTLISDRESLLADDAELEDAFRRYIANLLLSHGPQSGPEKHRMYNRWEDSLKRELAGWRAEIDGLESKVPDRRIIYDNVRTRVLQALEAQALEAGLLPQAPRPGNPVRRGTAETSSPALSDMEGRMSLVELGEWSRIAKAGGRPPKPASFRDPQGDETSVNNWTDLFFTVAKWLVDKEILFGPFSFQTMTKRYLIHSEPFHPNGRKFGWSRELPNGLFLECQWGAKESARLSGRLLAEFGQDPSQFQVLLR